MTYRGLDLCPTSPDRCLKSRFRSQHLKFFVAKITTEDLVVLKGAVRGREGAAPSSTRSTSWSEAPEALGYLGEGHARGKVVISV